MNVKEKVAVVCGCCHITKQINEKTFMKAIYKYTVVHKEQR